MNDTRCLNASGLWQAKARVNTGHKSHEGRPSAHGGNGLSAATPITSLTHPTDPPFSQLSLHPLKSTASAPQEDRCAQETVAISAFDTAALSRHGQRGMQWGSKYQYGSLIGFSAAATPSASGNDSAGPVEDVHFYSFVAPSAASGPPPQRQCFLTEKGPCNVSAVHQLEYDDPLQPSEDRSAYCRQSLVATHKLRASRSGKSSEADTIATAVDRGTEVEYCAKKQHRGRYTGWDRAAEQLARKDAEWLRDFKPYARPFDVQPSGGRCAHREHYTTTFERVQPVPQSAMYMSEAERFAH